MADLPFRAAVFSAFVRQRRLGLSAGKASRSDRILYPGELSVSTMNGSNRLDKLYSDTAFEKRTFELQIVGAPTECWLRVLRTCGLGGCESWRIPVPYPPGAKWSQRAGPARKPSHLLPALRVGGGCTRHA